MIDLFYHGYERMHDTLRRVQDPILQAQAYEALACMGEAFKGTGRERREIEKQFERLQKRYNKLKGCKK